jgi:heme iron utilization protein
MSGQEITSERMKALRDLQSSCRTLLLSTASATGAPDQSYAPYVCDKQGRFYVFISEMARHTSNLLENPQVAVMFIRDEVQSHNLFARERAVYQCTAGEIARDSSAFNEILALFEQDFGEIVGLLRTLSDFHLFALMPQSGRYVAGFGQAFNIDIKSGAVLMPDKTGKP